METLVYTFQSFKGKSQLEEKFNNLFVFNRPKEDLEKFKEIIRLENPDLILGIAKSDNYSRIEVKAINQFNKGKISKTGKIDYRLFKPNINFKIGKPTYSFCNWTMYKIAEFIEEKGIKFSFIHLKSEDINKLLNSL